MTQRHKVVVFDLDDTLFKEMDFLISAYREIGSYFEKQFGKYGLWSHMLSYYTEKRRDVFGDIIHDFNMPISRDELLKIYRNHKPSIHLDKETKYVLDYLQKNDNYVIAIITDGRSITQRNKIEALGLYDYIKNKTDIFISEEIGHTKIEGVAFGMIEKNYPECDYFYIGDNPEKDFAAPNGLLWETICILDNGRNIHPQKFDIDDIFLPKYKVNNITEILNII